MTNSQIKNCIGSLSNAQIIFTLMKITEDSNLDHKILGRFIDLPLAERNKTLLQIKENIVEIFHKIQSSNT
ncbi:MAG TPA: hypothetical protein DD381_07030 [Lentisphaeria bacterium]|nr:MAG: hypothetical protein A2X47_10875 [Lentisphaerae bacterium GWF2_38_69]HBM16077.1 hypothetical protein [Lentisphaeria bacterium]